MAKTCNKCNASVNSKSFECPYCGANDFHQEIIENNTIQSETKIETNINTNNELYSSKLENLIEMALSDGELSEKEKQVLFKKAEMEGIDLDEFEMVMDAKLKNKLNASQPSKIISTSSLSENNKPVNPERYVELEKLIDIALTDGMLSEMERETIINKGITSGIPQGEISMIIDSKLIEKQKKDTQVAAPKSDKFGDVRKCPSCASIAESFQTKCSDCGHEFNNIGANISIGKLFEMLNACENERKDESYNSISGAFGSLISKGLDQVDKITERKKSIISGFPIPNTKDDILEFLSTAIPNAKQRGTMWTKSQPENKSHNDLVPTWHSKCEQIVMKAKFSMKEDKKVLEEIMNYANEIGIK